MYDLTWGFRSKRVCKEVGNYNGSFVEVNVNNFGGIWRNYMCVKVSIDVRKPLKRKMKIKKAEGEWEWITFKYERLPTFCFFCGLLGHNEKFCEKLFDCEVRPEVMPYGIALRAPNRRDAGQIGERWLRTLVLIKVDSGNMVGSVDRMMVGKEGSSFMA